MGFSDFVFPDNDEQAIVNSTKVQLKDTAEVELAKKERITGVYQYGIDKRRLNVGVTEDDVKGTVTTVILLWRLRGRAPSVAEVMDAGMYASEEWLYNIVRNDVFIEMMRKLGYDWVEGKRGPMGLSTKQALVIESITNPHDTASIKTRLKRLGVTEFVYNEWLNQPAFRTMIDRYAEQAIKNHHAVAVTSLLGNVGKGNMDAIKYYFQMTGRFDPSADNKSERDIREVVGVILDIITANVTDKRTLDRIGGEILKVLEGKK